MTDRTRPIKTGRFDIEDKDRQIVVRSDQQVLGEFYTTVTKLPQPLSQQDAWVRLNNHASAWTVYDLTPQVVLEAVRGVRERSLSYWDAQIWGVARLHHIPIVLSEDFQDGFLLEGVRFMNPLSAKAGGREWLESL